MTESQHAKNEWDEATTTIAQQIKNIVNSTSTPAQKLEAIALQIEQWRKVSTDTLIQLNTTKNELEKENEQLRNALKPFADVGAWLFARPKIPDETPIVNLMGINGHTGMLTRGQFKAANLACNKYYIKP